MTNLNFQPKPDGDRYVAVSISYKRITDGKPSTAALLSALEFLAKSTFLGGQYCGEPLPDSIAISGDCNYPRLNALLDGWLKPSAIREKLQLLESLGYISIQLSVNRQHRGIVYHRKAIAEALSKGGNPNDPNGSTPPKSEGVRLQKVEASPQKVEAMPPKSEGVRLQKVEASRSSRSNSNYLEDPSLKGGRDFEKNSQNPSQEFASCQQPEIHAAQQVTSRSRFKSSAARCDDLFSKKSLPPWRIGNGRNDWNEAILDGICKWLNEAFRRDRPATRADAIAYITKRQYPEHPEHDALLARIDEVLSQNKVSKANNPRYDVDTIFANAAAEERARWGIGA